jgi:hypothetical protein
MGGQQTIREAGLVSQTAAESQTEKADRLSPPENFEALPQFAAGHGDRGRG